MNPPKRRELTKEQEAVMAQLATALQGWSWKDWTKFVAGCVVCFALGHVSHRYLFTQNILSPQEERLVKGLREQSKELHVRTDPGAIVARAQDPEALAARARQLLKEKQRNDALPNPDKTTFTNAAFNRTSSSFGGNGDHAN
ncbi:MAG: hypothetical protein AAF483_14890 [Planctomycetota bacterium]